MKKKIGIVITIIVILLAVGAIALTLIKNKKAIDSKKEVKIVETAVAVTAATVEMKETSSIIDVVGTTKANKEVMIPAETAGQITRVNFKLGDQVAQGTLLALIEDTYKRLAVEAAQINYDKFLEDFQRFTALREGDAVTEVQLRDIRVGLENADVQLKNAKKQLSDTRITAPFSGVITSKNTELGAYATAGGAIAGMADVSQLKVTLAVSESNVYNLKVGQEITATTDVFPDVIYKGIISSISPQGSNAHTYPVEITLPNPKENTLKAGTYVRVKIDTGKTGSVLMIPRDAIVSSVKDPSVYLVKGDQVQLTRIGVGQNYGSFIEITEGLAEGDQVVTNGQINLSDGTKVMVSK